MFRHLQIRRRLYVAIVLTLAAEPAFGAEGVIYNMVDPGCPSCRTRGSPPCPANVKYFGYYPTRWRPWPGTEPMPTPAAQTQPNHVEVPPAEQEAVGKPNSTSGDTGASTTPSGGSTTDPNSSSTPTSPSALPPVAVPLLNGLPVPNGAQLPNGAPVPAVTLPNGGATSDPLLPSNQPDPAAKTFPLPAPTKTPSKTPANSIPGEPGKLNQVWPDPTRPSATPAAMSGPMVSSAPTALANANGLRIVPLSAPGPSYQWPPVNMLRTPTIKAGYQTPAETPAPASTLRDAAASIEPLPPLAPTRTSAVSPIPSNSLRIDMPPMAAPKSLVNSTASSLKESSSTMSVNTPLKTPSANHSDENVSMLIIAQKPAHPAAIPADDWTAKPETGAAETKNSTSADPLPQTKTLNWSAANSPAMLAPIYKCPTPDRAAANATANSPGAISSVRPMTTQSGSDGEIRFSPLRDAVVHARLATANNTASASVSDIDPLQIGHTIADDQQPSMRPLPMRNGLPTSRFEASDYISQDRAAGPTSYASAHQPLPGTTAAIAQRTTDAAVKPVSFEQTAPAAAPASNLTAIDPLEVARSLGATPAPSVPAATRPQFRSTSIYGAAGSSASPVSR